MKNYIYILLIFLSFSSCEKEIEYEGKTEPTKLVVNSIFDNKNNWSLNVLKTRDILINNDIELVKDATVEIYDDKTNQLVTNLLFVEDKKVYTSLEKPQSGKTYKLVLKHKDFNNLTAVSNIPDSISFSVKATNKVEENGRTKLDIPIVIKDKKEYKNYYLLRVRTDSYYQEDNGFDDNSDKKGEFAGSFYSSFRVKNLFENQNIIDDEEDDEFSTDTYIYFEDKYFDGENKEINVLIDFYDPNPTYDYKLVIELASINYELFQYYKTIDLYFENEGSPFSQPVQIFNNINNGLGVFGGQHIVERNIMLK
jgi:hypothetical protein